MTDFIDSTGEREQAIADARISNRVRYVGRSANECEDCGEAIPEGRRLAVPGCKRCTDCEELKSLRL